MSDKQYTVRLDMRDGGRHWTEEQTIWAPTPEDAIAIAASRTQSPIAVSGATIREAD
jgi:hypothetical protein